MKKITYLFTAAATLLLYGCIRDKFPVGQPENKRPVELTGSIDGVAALGKEKAFFLYAMLSPGEEWDEFYIDRDEAVLNTDGTIGMKGEYYWPVEDNMYRFIGIMNSADQTQPLIDMNGPAIGMNAGETPASDLLLSNNLLMRRSSVVNEMKFRHVMTQVVFELVIDGDDNKAYSLTGKIAAGKQTGTYSALAYPKTDVAAVADGTPGYVIDLELTATETDRSPRRIYYLVPDGSDLNSLTEAWLNGREDHDIPLVTDDGEPVTLKSGASYLVRLHVSTGIVTAMIDLGSWMEESLGDQNADLALSDVQWKVSYPDGFEKITKVEITDKGGKSYFAPLNVEGVTMAPADLPSAYNELAVWLDNLRVVLRNGEYTLEDGKLDIKVIFVGSAERLAAIAADEASLAGNYRQAAHIDLSAGHTPIGNANAQFTGVYDGGGYQITNFRLTSPDEQSGLFGSNSGTIKNVTIAKTLVEDLRYQNGLVCGYNDVNGIIEDCVNYADFRSSTQADTESTRIGGIVGANQGTINNCENHGEGISIFTFLGGICGGVSGTSTVESCRNYGNIRMTAASGSSFTGGVIGGVQGASKVRQLVNYGDVTGISFLGGVLGFAYSSISDMENHGNVNGSGSYVGGITGYLDKSGSTLSESFNYGVIYGYNQVGGILGWAKSSVIVSGCRNNGPVITPHTYAGGIVGYVGASCVIRGNVNTAAVTNTEADNNVHTGGIVGFASEASITENVNIGPIESAGQQTGGIVGSAHSCEINLCVNTGPVTGLKYLSGITSGYGIGTTMITACLNTGTITAMNTDGDSYAAGIVPRVSAASRITACVNTGVIKGTGMLGGIGSYLYDTGTITSCYSAGNITRSAGTSSWMGGVVGYNSATIISSFWAGAVDTDRGIGAANVDENDAVRFGENEWPTEDLNDGWKLAPNGGYWESLGHWDATDPVYPSLAGLPEIPTP